MACAYKFPASANTSITHSPLITTRVALPITSLFDTISPPKSLLFPKRYHLYLISSKSARNGAPLTLENYFRPRTHKRNTKQFDIRYKNNDCTWRLYASRYDSAKFVIKTFIDEHYNFPGAQLSNSATDSHFIARVVTAKVQEMPDYATCEILQPSSLSQSELLASVSSKAESNQRHQQDP